MLSFIVAEVVESREEVAEMENWKYIRCCITVHKSSVPS